MKVPQKFVRAFPNHLVPAFEEQLGELVGHDFLERLIRRESNFHTIFTFYLINGEDLYSAEVFDEMVVEE